MVSLISFVINAKFIVGAIIGGLVAVGYFTWTGSQLVWKKKK